MQKGPTKKQAKVLEAISRRLAMGEPPPTYRDLCEELGWSSTGTARDHLRALAKKGLVELSGNAHRNVKVSREAVPARRLPILGRVVAGVPEHADENVEGFLALPTRWAHPDYFALQVVGKSMEGISIYDGDYVVAKRAEVAKSNDVVVATVDGETTLKRLSRRGREYFLVAENPQFGPIRMAGRDILIHGVVVALFRSFTPQDSFQFESGR